MPSACLPPPSEITDGAKIRNYLCRDGVQGEDDVACRACFEDHKFCELPTRGNFLVGPWASDYESVLSSVLPSRERPTIKASPLWSAYDEVRLLVGWFEASFSR